MKPLKIDNLRHSKCTNEVYHVYYEFVPSTLEVIETEKWSFLY